MTARLPEAFEALEPFVDRWALDDFQARYECRFDSDMTSINAFYGAMQPLAEHAMAEIERHPLDRLPPKVHTLFKLTMSLVHAAQAVECYRQPQPLNIIYPNELKILRCSEPS